MEKSDLLRTEDQVAVTIYGPDGSRLYETTCNGYHRIEEAIRAAVDNANLSVNPEDCVFEIDNKTTGVSHRYRINAHGNLKLIV